MFQAKLCHLKVMHNLVSLVGIGSLHLSIFSDDMILVVHLHRDEVRAVEDFLPLTFEMSRPLPTLNIGKVLKKRSLKVRDSLQVLPFPGVEKCHQQTERLKEMEHKPA